VLRCGTAVADSQANAFCVAGDVHADRIAGCQAGVPDRVGHELGHDERDVGSDGSATARPTSARRALPTASGRAASTRLMLRFALGVGYNRASLGSVAEQLGHVRAAE